MSFGKFIFIPIFIALQAFSMMLVQRYIPGNSIMQGGGLITWVAFQAWAMYFFAGFAPWNDKESGPCPRMGGKTLLGYIGGIACSIAIFELNGIFGSLNSSTGGHAWGLYLAVFVVVVGVICCERVPFFNFVPAWFIGAGVFFGLMTYLTPAAVGIEGKWNWYLAVAGAELVACVVGLIYGWTTVTFRVWYEAKVTAPAAAEEEPATDAA